MSKVKTLQLAIEYINQLQNQLQFTNQHSVSYENKYHPIIIDKKSENIICDQ